MRILLKKSFINHLKPIKQNGKEKWEKNNGIMAEKLEKNVVEYQFYIYNITTK
jgi:hypothetical protein